MEYKITRAPTDELYHYGVLGMKWGVRKRDYTPSGTKRKKLLKTIKKNKKYNNVEKTRQLLSKEVSEENIKKVKEFNKRLSNYYNKDNIVFDKDGIWDDRDSELYKKMIKEAKEKILKNPEKYVVNLPWQSIEEAKKYAKDHNISIWETKNFSEALDYETDQGSTYEKYNKMWKELHKDELKKQKEIDAGWEKIYNEKKKYYNNIVNDIVGDYGSTKIGSYSWDPSFKSIVSDEINKILDQY